MHSKEKATYWATSSTFDSATREEVKQILDDDLEIEERFATDLDFGTGGLRGLVGAGTNRINVYNIRKASLALARYLQQQFPDRQLTVAIAYDSRQQSRVFAEATCEILAGQGIHSLITAEVSTVPLLSFIVRHYRCQAGVCITASHNPKEYNGFKVYWQHGGQVVPPHDRGIIEQYNSISDYDLAKIDFEKSGYREIGREIYQPFIDSFSKLARAELDDVKLVYTPLHGAGFVAVSEALARLGYHNVAVVEQQQTIDGNFSTVTSPNPEEPASMSLAVELARNNDAELVLATDPDGDRLGVMCRDGGDYRRLDGNQLLCLLLDYLLAESQLTAQDLVVTTIVTSRLFTKIANHYHVHVDTTLTGFKWIGQLIEDYETGKKTPYRRFIFGGEESFGMLYGRTLRDKDAVSACCLAAQLTCYLRTHGKKSWFDALDDLYRRHGVYHTEMVSRTLPGLAGKKKIAEMIAKLRDNSQQLAGCPVQKMIDYASGEVRKLEGGKPVSANEKITLPRSEVLQFFLEDNSRISVRPSGTEPKIKFYIETHGQLDSSMNLAQVKEDCYRRAMEFKNFFDNL